MDDRSESGSHVIPLRDADQLRDARTVILHEAAALSALAESLDHSFCAAVRLIRNAPGCVIVTGVGKAGLIGQKIVATLASTGTRAWFLHPTEAVHGDLGCIHDDDVVLAISNSGRSEEVIRLLEPLNQRNIPIIAVTGDANNRLSRSATVTICIGQHEEAGMLRLAPTTSTTTMLALGDALALSLSHLAGFTARDFARLHPAGSLGRRLQPVSEVMRTGPELRIADDTRTIRSVIVDQQRPGRRSGAVLLTGKNGQLTGIFTDSDLVRLLEKRRDAQLDQPVFEVMTVNPCTVRRDALLPTALELFSSRKLSELPVIDESGLPVGLIDITDVIDLPASARTHRSAGIQSGVVSHGVTRNRVIH